MFFFGGIAGLVLFLFWVWAILDVIATDGARCRSLPKFGWLLIVILLSGIGALAWVLLGRPERAGIRPGDTEYRTPGRAVGPEDAPDWTGAPSTSPSTRNRSEELDRRLEEWEAEQRRLRRDEPGDEQRQ